MAAVPSTVPVRISSDLANEARTEAKALGRSVAAQVEHWAVLGRMFEAMPSVSVPTVRKAVSGELDPSEMTDSIRVRDALLGRLPVDELTDGEEELYYDLVGMIGPRPEARAFFEERRRRGGGVGTDASGRLMRTLPGGAAEPYRPA